MERSETPQEAGPRGVDRLHLAARVADEEDGAVLVEQAGDPLVVVDAAVHEAHGPVGVEAVEHQRLEQAGHAGRGGHGVPEADAPWGPGASR